MDKTVEGIGYTAMKPVDYVTDAATEIAASTGLSALIDRHFHGSDYYEVGREKIREYAALVRCGNLAYRVDDAARELGYPGLVAPPAFFSMVAAMIQGVLLRAYVDGAGFRSIIQTDQQAELHRPIVVGDRLGCEVWIDTYRQTLGGDLIGLTSVLTDLDGAPVVTSRTRLASRADLDEHAAAEIRNLLMCGAGPAPSLLTERRWDRDRRVAVPPAPGPRRARFTVAQLRSFADISVGAELPPRTVFLTSGDLVRYAGVSGDPNPIHWSPGIAGLFRLDSVVAHGMLTTGIGAGFVAAYLDDPGAVSAYRIRLISPVFVGSEGALIEFGGRVKSIDAENRTVTVAIAARQEGREIFGRATVTVRLRDDNEPVRPGLPR
ncbi:fused (3R)-hydroxyacyl-ACP dehydratase subunits HadA/HadB [Nocardia brasiliensis]